MVLLNEAKKIALDYLNTMKFPYKLVLIEEKIVEIEEGYLFYWDSKNHAQDGMTDRILGSTPFIVNKLNGTIYRLGYGRTHHEIEKYKAKLKNEKEQGVHPQKPID